MPKRAPFPQSDLADRLRRALEDANITQADLARACEVTDQAVHSWIVTGRIAKEHLPRICALTGKSLEYFLVGLKNWRRAAAIALPSLLSLPLALDVASRLVCVICQIKQCFNGELEDSGLVADWCVYAHKFKEYVRGITIPCARSLAIHSR